ncbi:MAG: oligoendopeptidase F [Planctomycetes bacterium]|nr:oligoendopeptidase F [Planctomycetota bacterium]
MNTQWLHLLSGLCLVFSLTAVSAYSLERADVPAEQQWNLSDIYPSDDAWKEAKTALEKRFPEVEVYQGKLGESAGNLLQCYDLVFEIQKEFSKLFSYASLKSDLDVRQSKPMEMRESLGPMAATLGAKIAWMSPEILAIPEERINAFYKEEPGLEIYRPVIDDILRLKAHTLSALEEKIMADAGLVINTPDSVYSLFSDADIPRASVTLSDGETVRLDAASYTYYRGVQNRWDRERVFDAFFSNINQFRGTFGALLNGEVNKNLFRTRARHYGSCLESALSGPNVPVEVYKNLIRNVHKNLPTLWRYLELRKKLMGLKELRYSDLYASVVKEVDVKFTVEEAKDLVLQSVAPLGRDYVDVLVDGFDHNWIDWHPTTGKRSGAYSNGSLYDLHPYVLMNFTGTYEEVSTLAHELGHSMHSYHSNNKQPFPTADYTTFVAEVASTCNEHLLMNYMLKHTDDDGMKLFLLGSYLDNIRLTLFRQTQFAEFEMLVHDMVENGQALTGDNLNETYAKILHEYYGVDKGVTTINPACYAEWAYIPHFYMNFYVFTYATSITASTALSQRILDGGGVAVDKYREFLSLGNSLPPVEELKVAGVDMTTDEPFTMTMKTMEKAMDQIEKILARQRNK